MLVFVNGCFVGRNDNGYAPFRFDITDFLAVGQKNCIVARVDASFGDGWFYEGAGIYRHVWLTKSDPLHLGEWESYVRPTATDGEAVNLELATVVVNEGKNFEKAAVSWQILDAAGKTVATAEAPAQVIDVDGNVSFAASAKIDHPALWSVESPNLYTAIVTVKTGDKVRDAERVNFGVRFVRFDADHGFFLNGQHAQNPGHLQPPGSRRSGRGCCLTACRPFASACCSRWVAMPCAPRTTCPRRSWSKPATAWA